MHTDVELLAPAGSWEAVLAAVENGADALYLGGRLFNARQFAANFDNEQLKKAIDYCHVRGVKVYLTMNTLVLDKEMEEAIELAGEAYQMGIDGVIVQDLGFAGVMRKMFSKLDLHASTQMTVYNLEGVKTLERLGFKRAVLARELSIEEINHITKNTTMEIEVFVHGALCISYSGQCLMSSIIGGRSGNRGKCAQPCRLPYELLRDGKMDLNDPLHKGFLLSPKDLCSINELGNMINSGVKSLKIEGRMKSPEYVATVVRIYRKYLDTLSEMDGYKAAKNLCTDKKDLQELAQIFNRGGLSTGYLKGKSGQDMMCYEKPKNWGIYAGTVIGYNKANKTVEVKLEEDIGIGDGIEIWNGEETSPGTIVTEIKINGKNFDVAGKSKTASLGSITGNIIKGNKIYKTSDKNLNVIARSTFSGKLMRKVMLYGRVEIKNGLLAMLELNDYQGNQVQETGNIPEKAINRPLTKDKILEQMNKTGSTPFEFNQLEVELDENLSVPVSEINNMRRTALENMELKRVLSYKREIPDDYIEKKKNLLYFPGNSRNKLQKISISIHFHSYTDKIDYADLPADRIYLPFTTFLNEEASRKLEKCHKSGVELFAWLPSITRGNYDNLLKSKLDMVVQSGITGLLVGNAGWIAIVEKYTGIKVAGEYSLNIFNSLSLEEAQKMGLSSVTLSPELNLGQINALKDIPELDKEAVVYGRLPLMTSEYCPVGSIYGGHKSGKKCSGVCSKGVYHLRDRMGVEFPIYCDRIDCRSTIFNSNVLYVLDSMDKIRKSGVNTIRINITNEKPEEIKEILEVYKEAANTGVKTLDRHVKLNERMKQKGFTKGHYFRGV